MVCGAGLCHTERTFAMSAPSLSEHLALVAADPSLVGHPVVAGLVVSVEALARELAELREENAELRRQLGRHSGNSGQPPSQDGPSAPPRTRRQRRSQGRAPGGQPGHAGTTRRQVAAAQVDRPVDHWPARCRGCRVHTRAAFPADVAGPVQFGPRLEALTAYLRYAQHLPAARLRALLRELHGVSLSTATVEALCQRAAARLAPEAARQQAQALAVPVACMDETGLRVAGATLWLHVMGDETVTAYHLGARGDVREGYASTAVHDRFASYWNAAMADETDHALCHAHLLRNLEEIVELEQAPEGWAARMQRWLLEARCRQPSARRRPRPGTPSWHRSWTTTRAGRRRPAAGTAATTWPGPCGRNGRPACASWPTRPCPSPTTGRSGPCAWPSCR